jgi:hypothetical protein
MNSSGASVPLAVHELKTHPGPFAGIREHRKPFEIRKDDRGFRVGDRLRLQEWVPTEPSGYFTGRESHATVCWISRGPDWGLPIGLAVLGLQAVHHGTVSDGGYKPFDGSACADPVTCPCLVGARS